MRDLARTRILEAAQREFGLYGFRGARLESIAHRASVPRGLIAYYFGTKEGLFQALAAERRSSTERLQQQLSHGPDDPFAWSLSLFALGELTLEWAHMLIWEGLEWSPPGGAATGNELVLEAGRREYWQRRIAEVRSLQVEGKLPSHLDTEQLTFFLWVLGMYPYLVPQIAYLITGGWPSDERFQVEYERFVRGIAQKLRGAAV
jgi:TetR/AcrR family transcriptional regulator